MVIVRNKSSISLSWLFFFRARVMSRPVSFACPHLIHFLSPPFHLFSSSVLPIKFSFQSVLPWCPLESGLLFWYNIVFFFSFFPDLSQLSLACLFDVFLGLTFLIQGWFFTCSDAGLRISSWVCTSRGTVFSDFMFASAVRRGHVLISRRFYSHFLIFL